jgi:hypothetical protein
MTHKDCGGKIINNEAEKTFRCEKCDQEGTDVVKGVVEEENPDLETAEEYSIV